MTVLTFDTHQLVTELKAAGFDEKQAEAVVNTVRKTHAEANFATKADLRELEYRLTTKFLFLQGAMQGATIAILAALIKMM